MKNKNHNPEWDGLSMVNEFRILDKLKIRKNYNMKRNYEKLWLKDGTNKLNS